MAREDNVRSKLPAAIKEIDIHRKELQNIKIRLEERRKSLFEVTVKAFQQNDKSKAGVYAAEHAEVRKVIKVVEASELALTQVILRLQSITDIGDVIAHISQAFKVTRRVSREVAGLVPSLDSASRHINETLSETMFDIGEVSPNINLDVRTDSREELIEQAKRLAEQRADEMQQSLDLTPQIISHELQEVGHGTPLLASGDEESYPEDNYDATLGVIYSAPKEVKH
jgi:division protein CdvB (Snf7/Vps24/ESCRT-III family)